MSLPVKSLRALLTLGVILLGFLTASSVQAEIYQIGDREIIIPTPRGFVHVTDEMPIMLNYLQIIQPDGNETLAFFIPESDAELALQGDIPECKFMAKVQVTPEMKNAVFGNSDFDDFKDTIRQEMAGVIEDTEALNQGMEDVGRNIQKEYSVEIEREISGLTLHGFHHESENSIAYTLSTEIEETLDGQREGYSESVTMTSINAAGALLFTYIHSAPELLNENQEIALAWEKSILASNDFPVSANTNEAQSVRDLVAKYSASVVTIETSGTSGSGVIVDSDGIIVTNLHVIQNEKSVNIQLSNGDQYQNPSVIDYDKAKDFVILKIPAFGLTAAELGNSNDISAGDDVVAIGSPAGFEQTVSNGIVSAIREFDGYKMIQTNAAISPGSSGGALFESSGLLVGITTSIVEEAQNLGFAIPINYIRGMLSDEPRYTLEEFIAKIESETPSQDDLDHAKLRRVFNELGIAPVDLGEGKLWGLDVTEITEDNETTIIVTYIINSYVIISVYPELPSDHSIEDILLKGSRLNFALNGAKMGMDDDDIVILTEIPIESLTEQSYWLAIIMVANYETEFRKAIRD